METPDKLDKAAESLRSVRVTTPIIRFSWPEKLIVVLVIIFIGWFVYWLAYGFR